MSGAILLESLAAAAYLGFRWFGERAASGRLRAEIAVLKRRLARRGG
jgi:hypothetical protein